MNNVHDLKRIFDVEEDQDLARILGKTPGAVSNWKASGKLPAAVKELALEKMAERGIVAEPIPPYSSQTKTPTISPLVQGIIDVALKLPDSPQIQAKALQEITATFISSQITEKE